MIAVVPSGYVVTIKEGKMKYLLLMILLGCNDKLINFNYCMKYSRKSLCSISSKSVDYIFKADGMVVVMIKGQKTPVIIYNKSISYVKNKLGI